jgi:hypothetical protein
MCSVWISEQTANVSLGHAHSAGRFRFRLRFWESAPVGAKNVLCLTVQVRIVAAGSGGSVHTVWVRRFTGMISSFLFRLSESESDPESACTIRVPLHNLHRLDFITEAESIYSAVQTESLYNRYVSSLTLWRLMTYIYIYIYIYVVPRR